MLSCFLQSFAKLEVLNAYRSQCVKPETSNLKDVFTGIFFIVENSEWSQCLLLHAYLFATSPYVRKLKLQISEGYAVRNNLCH